MNTVSMQKLLDIGIALSAEKNSDNLFELILTAAMDITNCDGGILYFKNDKFLDVKIMIVKSKNIKEEGKYEKSDSPSIPLSLKNICSHAAISGKLINIENVYASDIYDFSLPKNYEAIAGEKNMSMLVVPMEDDKSNCVGVIQLINALDENENVIPFEKSCEPVIMSIASQTAICTSNMNYSSEVQELLDSLVRVMSTAIDARTPYNANHTRNMVKYAEKFIAWLNENEKPWHFSEQERRQFIMSVWLHDSGKITVPLEVMDKKTRLGSHLTQLFYRFKIIGLLNKINKQSGKIDGHTYDVCKEELLAAGKLVLKANEATFLDDDILKQIKALANKTYIDENGTKKYWITKAEENCLTVKKGTLTKQERHVMEGHVTMTRKMLEEVKFPPNYSMVTSWAQKHHEFLDGSGYPLGLKSSEIPQEVRLLTILDIFDALTARDRPYKMGMSTEKAFLILNGMATNGKIDKNILDMFYESHVWQ